MRPFLHRWLPWVTEPRSGSSPDRQSQAPARSALVSLAWVWLALGLLAFVASAVIATKTREERDEAASQARLAAAELARSRSRLRRCEFILDRSLEDPPGVHEPKAPPSTAP